VGEVQRLLHSVFNRLQHFRLFQVGAQRKVDHVTRNGHPHRGRKRITGGDHALAQLGQQIQREPIEVSLGPSVRIRVADLIPDDAMDIGPHLRGRAIKGELAGPAQDTPQYTSMNCGVVCGHAAGAQRLAEEAWKAVQKGLHLSASPGKPGGLPADVHRRMHSKHPVRTVARLALIKVEPPGRPHLISSSIRTSHPPRSTHGLSRGEDPPSRGR